MQISSSAYMGVETLVRLAMQSADGPCTTQGLAEWTNCPVSYTEALMARFCDAGLVVSRHGPGGGYVLAKPADQITVAEVFQAVDAPSDFAPHPPNTDTIEAEGVRDLQGTDLLWAALKSCVMFFLTNVSLADLAPQAADQVGDDADDDARIDRFDMQSTMYH